MAAQGSATCPCCLTWCERTLSLSCARVLFPWFFWDKANVSPQPRWKAEQAHGCSVLLPVWGGRRPARGTTHTVWMGGRHAEGCRVHWCHSSAHPPCAGQAQFSSEKSFLGRPHCSLTGQTLSAGAPTICFSRGTLFFLQTQCCFFSMGLSSVPMCSSFPSIPLLTSPCQACPSPPVCSLNVFGHCISSWLPPLPHSMKQGLEGLEGLLEGSGVFLEHH